MKKIEIADLISFLKDNLLTILTLVGVIIGIVLGVSLKETSEKPWTAREAMYLSFIGDLFLNLLRSLIIPLIIPSLIATIGGLNHSLSGKIGLRAVIFYMTTTVIAVILGIVLVSTIKPGAHGEKVISDESQKRNITTPDTLMDLLRNCFPPNIVRATMFQTRTSLTYPGESKEDENTGAFINVTDINTWLFEEEWQHNPNILGLVVMSIVMGVAISAAGEEGKVLLKIFQSISNVMMKVTSWVIYLAPVGVLFLVAGQIVGRKNMREDFPKLAVYFGTVVAGLTIHGFIVLPLLYTAVTKTLPFRFIGNMSNAMMTAFGTASSSATLPVTIKCLEEKNNLDPIITRFVVPIGATINMDGTALYEAVAAIFIAQMYKMDPTIAQSAAVAITATAASIGAAGIPQAGLVTMVMVLDTVGLPSDSVALILSVDWLLDRFRTTINVLGDSIGAAIVNHLSKKDLEEMHQGDKSLEMANSA